MSNSHDNWKATWDWAEKVWAPEGDGDYTFNWFFGGVASAIAEREGWEEVGSSDVWHASFCCVKCAKEEGKVSTREDLRQYVLDYQGIGEWELR
jgi:hypothetical protein